MGPPSPVELRPAGERLGTPGRHSAKILGRSSLRQGARSKHKRQSSPASPSGSYTLHVWRGKWAQRRIFVLEIMSHTHESTIINTAVGH